MTEERAKRKLSAILSADVKGYSRLMGDDELATVRTLEAYREMIAEVIRAYSGRVVDSPGDNVLAEFASVVDAVESAVEIQKEIKAKNADLPENRRMEFRIGINLGDVIEEGERIYGDGVNVAARIEGLAEGGGICISRTAFDQVKNKLNLGYENLGEHSVKNIAEPVRVYRVLMEPEAAGKVIDEERPRRVRWVAIAAVITIVFSAGGLAIWNFYFRPPSMEVASVEKMAFPLPNKPSIAVLPFTNMSGDPEQELFSDGITEEIITALSKTPKMFVIARTSSFKYKGKEVDVRTVGRELGVRYVLEGSVRKSEDQLRITAQLVDAKTGNHVWAERYDRGLKDVFALQDEITKKIIIELQVELTTGEEARVFGKGTSNLEAYLNVLQAGKYINRTNKEDNVRARQVAEQAIALDPGYAGAYVTLAWTHFFDVVYRSSKSPKESLARAYQLAHKAFTIDDSQAGSHIILGYIHLRKRQHEKAIAEMEQALTLVPNSARNHMHLGRALTFAGRLEEAIPLLERVLRLDPMPGAIELYSLGHAYIMTGRYDEAIATCKKAIKIEPKSQLAHGYLIFAYSVSGREQEARTQAEEILRINPKSCVPRRLGFYKNQADMESHANALRKAGLPGCPPLRGSK
jgi:adenylate cyclase